MARAEKEPNMTQEELKLGTPQVEEVKVEAPKAKAGKAAPKIIRACHGYMVDPFTNITYDQTPKELVEMTNWIQCQLDAGKMAWV